MHIHEYFEYDLKAADFRLQVTWRRRMNVKRAHAPLDIASQLMRGDVTKTKPCALGGARDRDRQRNRTKLFGEGSVLTGSSRTRQGAPGVPARLHGITRVDSVVGVALASPASHYASSGCRSYPRTGVARARNGWRPSRVGRRRRSSSAPTIKPSRFFYGESAVSCSFSLYLSLYQFLFCFLLSFSLAVLCSFRGVWLLDARHSCYSGVYIDPTDSSVCLHASASILALTDRLDLLHRLLHWSKDEECINMTNIIICNDQTCTRIEISLWLAKRIPTVLPFIRTAPWQPYH